MLSRRRISYALILVIGTFAVRYKLAEHSENIERRNVKSDTKIPDDNVSTKPIDQVDVIVGLYGQLGNHLHLIALPYIMKFFAQKLDPPVEVNVHYTPWSATEKWTSMTEEIKTCFTNFEDVNFYEFDSSFMRENTRLLGKPNFGSTPNTANGMVEKLWKKKINYIVNKKFPSFENVERTPSLKSMEFTPAYLVDQYYDDLLKLFDFNDKECCNEVPDPDETVVHIRGFFHEVGKDEKQIKKGLQELDPNQMANDMLGHLTEGDKVALVAPSTEISRPYKIALEKKGINVRSVSQSRVQDFCFLMKTTKELVAHHLTTFAYWAGVLSKSVKKVSLYHVKSPLYTGVRYPWHYHNWEHPKLRDVFQYPEFEYD